VRAAKTEAALQGQRWTQDTAHTAAKLLQAEFQPITDLRASALYRKQVLGNLLQRLWLESQGQPLSQLEHLVVEDLA
jgi:xanthine dehydrogenase small subunit